MNFKLYILRIRHSIYHDVIDSQWVCDINELSDKMKIILGYHTNTKEFSIENDFEYLEFEKSMVFDKANNNI